MSWIKEITYEESSGQLRKLYDRVKGPNKNVDNVMLAHGHRPHTLEGHMTLYKAVLHNSNNRLPKWYLETIGIKVSMLNNCDYCVDHHFQGLKRLLNDDVRADAIRKGLATYTIADVLDKKFLAGLGYAKKLSQLLPGIDRSDIDGLREAGFTDGEILEINQVVSYFNYANRTVLGLGVDKKGDILGLSPNDSDNRDDWSHT